jgi:predicted nicotinamide N-methyase
VLATDYGTEQDTALVQALQANADALKEQACLCVSVLPYVWGCDVTPLLALLPVGRYDVIFCCDLLFARQAHSALLRSIDCLLAAKGVVHLAFSHHDPEKRHLDLAFFALALAPPFCFEVTEQEGRTFPRDLFICDDGQDDARAVVYYRTLRRRPE